MLIFQGPGTLGFIISKLELKATKCYNNGIKKTKMRDGSTGSQTDKNKAITSNTESLSSYSNAKDIGGKEIISQQNSTKLQARIIVPPAPNTQYVYAENEINLEKELAQLIEETPDLQLTKYKGGFEIIRIKRNENNEVIYVEAINGIDNFIYENGVVTKLVKEKGPADNSIIEPPKDAPPPAPDVEPPKDVTPPVPDVEPSKDTTPPVPDVEPPKDATPPVPDVEPPKDTNPPEPTPEAPKEKKVKEKQAKSPKASKETPDEVTAEVHKLIQVLIGQIILLSQRVQLLSGAQAQQSQQAQNINFSAQANVHANAQATYQRQSGPIIVPVLIPSIQQTGPVMPTMAQAQGPILFPGQNVVQTNQGPQIIVQAPQGPIQGPQLQPAVQQTPDQMPPVIVQQAQTPDQSNPQPIAIEPSTQTPLEEPTPTENLTGPKTNQEEAEENPELFFDITFDADGNLTYENQIIKIGDTIIKDGKSYKLNMVSNDLTKILLITDNNESILLHKKGEKYSNKESYNVVATQQEIKADTLYPEEEVIDSTSASQAVSPANTSPETSPPTQSPPPKEKFLTKLKNKVSGFFRGLWNGFKSLWPFGKKK